MVPAKLTYSPTLCFTEVSHKGTHSKGHAHRIAALFTLHHNHGLEKGWKKKQELEGWEGDRRSEKQIGKRAGQI